jgi:hypothetical protein
MSTAMLSMRMIEAARPASPRRPGGSEQVGSTHPVVTGPGMGRLPPACPPHVGRTAAPSRQVSTEWLMSSPKQVMSPTPAAECSIARDLAAAVPHA